MSDLMNIARALYELGEHLHSWDDASESLRDSYELGVRRAWEIGTKATAVSGEDHNNG